MPTGSYFGLEVRYENPFFSRVGGGTMTADDLSVPRSKDAIDQTNWVHGLYGEDVIGSDELTVPARSA